MSLRRFWSRLFPLVVVSLLVVTGVLGDDDGDDEPVHSSEYADDEPADEPVDDSPEMEQSVYVMEHGFLSPQTAPEWMARGTLILKGSKRKGFDWQLADADEFKRIRSELHSQMKDAAGSNKYYAVSMFNTATPTRKLQASIPAKLLADNIEGWHDILEVTLGASGDAVGLSYRIRHTLGLELFTSNTKVEITEPSMSDGPIVPASARFAAGKEGEGGGSGEQPQQQTSFLRKYWWVILIVLFLISSAGGGDDGKSAGGKSSGGSSSRRA